MGAFQAQKSFLLSHSFCQLWNATSYADKLNKKFSGMVYGILGHIRAGNVPEINF